MLFRVSVDRRRSVARLRLAGEMDLASVDPFRSQVEPLDEEGLDLLIDLSELTFIDSSGLHELVRIHDRMARADRTVEFLALPPKLEKLFELTRVAYLITDSADSTLLANFGQDAT